MTEKIQLYDVFAALVPGILLMGATLALFPDAWTGNKFPTLPDAFSVIVLTTIALFLGHLIQAIGSLIEPAVYWTWGGRPSERAFGKGLGERYLPVDSGSRIREKLRKAVGGKPSDRSLFLYALAAAESDSTSRARSFNGSYAYHRALLISCVGVLCLGIGSAKHGALSALPTSSLVWVLVGVGALAGLLWYRARQRAFYYVREVLLTAERVMDHRKTSAGGGAKANTPEES